MYLHSQQRWQEHGCCAGALKFSLDQFDADTGKTGILRGSGRCCDPATADKSLPNSGCFDLPFNPNFQMTMLPGKSNKHARAIDVTFGAPNLLDPNDDEPFASAEANFQLRKIGGGFKSYD